MDDPLDVPEAVVEYLAGQAAPGSPVWTDGKAPAGFAEEPSLLLDRSRLVREEPSLVAVRDTSEG